MATAATAISKAMGSGFGGSDSRALLASNRASAVNARAEKVMTAWILETFEVLVMGPGAVAFLDKETGDWAGGTVDGMTATYCNVDARYFAAAARTAEGQAN